MSTARARSGPINASPIEELNIPVAVGAAGWDDFVAMCLVRNAVEAEAAGSGDLAMSPEEMLPHWHDPNERNRVFVARVDGRIVGRAMYGFSDDDQIAWLRVQVLADFRGRGLGDALHARAFATAIGEGKTIMQGNFDVIGDTPGPRIVSPSGFGSVPANAPNVRFAVARGYGLEMVSRSSRLALPVDPALLTDHRRRAEDAAGADYRVVRWQGRTPDRWLDDVAILHGRMMTDAPHGDLVMPSEEWTADRLRAQEDVHEQTGRGLLVSAAEHVPTGRLVGFSELDVPPELDRPIDQRDTLVLTEHRGHRLGMLLKVDNLQQLAESAPGHPSILTSNAEENRFMLDVNEAVGFVAFTYGSMWKREVTT